MRFYALKHTYGSDTIAAGERYDHTGTLHVFDSKKARDQWVSDGPRYRNERGYRTPLSGNSKRARHYRRGRLRASVTIHYRDGTTTTEHMRR